MRTAAAVAHLAKATLESTGNVSTHSSLAVAVQSIAVFLKGRCVSMDDSGPRRAVSSNVIRKTRAK
jgi:hypothetical protein